MPQDIFKPRGSTKASRPDAGGANIRSVPVFGIVKDNVDPNRSGRLRVYLSDFSGQDPDNASNWVTVNYMSNFFGSVRPSAGETGDGSYKHNPSSYGEWHAPPDIGTTVICVFVNGDMNYGFYIGCVPDPATLHMVPAIGATFADQQENVTFNNSDEASTYGGSVRLPTTNINTNNSSITDSPGFVTATKPVHSYTAAIMEQQGIIRDPVRGPISSSAQREAASRVGWGVSTPGRPIYSGGYDDETIADKTNLNTNNSQNLKVISRRGGHSIVMDDGDIIGRDQLVRIRTSKGHQILMSDDGQTLMILHSNGQSYIELGKEGTVDIYSTNSINLRTQGDLNLHADNNVNIHATKNLNIHAENMHVSTDKELKQHVGTNLKTSALGMVTTKVVGALSFEATGIASLASTSMTYINGGIINLNTGQTPIKPSTVDPLPLFAHTDTLQDPQKGFTAAPGKLLSVTSRAPAHAPWAHAGQGVDVKVDLGSSAQLPSGPSSMLSSAVGAGLSSGASPVKLATALSNPSTTVVSSVLNASATSALVGATAQKAATGPLSAALEKGAAIVPIGSQNIVAVGAFAQNPTQMASAGVLKPGSDRLVNSLVNSGANLSQAMPNTLFTGTAGAENLNNYTKNITAQTSTVVTNLQQSQTTLTNAGVITGKESADQIAGVVFASSSSGSEKTVNTVQSLINQTTADSSVIRDIGLGTCSVTETETTMGGFGGITQSVSAMSVSPSAAGNISTNTGTASSAFSAINASFPNFKTGVATNLGDAVKSQTAVSDSLSNMVGQSSIDAVKNLDPSATLAKITGFTGTSLLESTNIASGVVNLPGGMDAIASFTNKSLSGIVSAIPGGDAIKSLVNDSVTSAFNKIPLPLGGSLGAVQNTISKLPIGSLVGALSAISAVSSLFGGKGGVRTPSVAVNTTNRDSLTQKTNSLLGPGIPSPNFNAEISQQAVQSIAERNAQTASSTEITNKISKITALITNTQKEKTQLTLEERDAPAGDLNIKKRKTEIQTKLNALLNERAELQKQLAALRQ